MGRLKCLAFKIKCANEDHFKIMSSPSLPTGNDMHIELQTSLNS